MKLRQPKIGEPCLVVWNDAHRAADMLFDFPGWSGEPGVTGPLVAETLGRYLGVHDGAVVLGLERYPQHAKVAMREYRGHFTIPTEMVIRIYRWGEPLE